MENLAEYVIDDIGLPAFPCAENKAPMTARGYLDATSDYQIVREMFARPCLVGVPTGQASGIDVLDVDPKNGGSEWYEEHRAKLPKTRIHRTRSGGLHILFAHLTGLRNSASRIAPGIDVRAEGGYVIWWPAAGFSANEVPIEDAAGWPTWLLPLMMTPPKPPVPVYSGPITVDGSLRGLAGVLRVVSQAPDGERNSRLFWGANRISDMAQEGRIPLHKGQVLLEAAAARAGLPAIEIKRTIHGALVKGGRRG
ncbi:bifunctional DNA primase/polymerase [Methylocella sp.]|jgi:hypothetical protein|uniref:bifunctional DNA primase/polymerase n=1 Tax=Methylocella sp. TaxID=1978226 RepID=UPI003C2011BD